MKRVEIGILLELIINVHLNENYKKTSEVIIEWLGHLGNLDYSAI